MAIEDILKKIGDDARAEAESLLSVALAEADAIREQAEKKAAEVRSELKEKSRKKAEEHAARLETLAGLELRKDVLKEKRQLVEEAFAKARETIVNLPPDRYLAFLRPIIVEAVESGNEEIIPSSAHRNLFTPDFLKSLNDELGLEKGRLTMSGESGGFSGGFILRDGKKETNLTLDSLIRSQRDILEPKVASVLFGEGGADG